MTEASLGRTIEEEEINELTIEAFFLVRGAVISSIGLQKWDEMSMDEHIEMIKSTIRGLAVLYGVIK